MRLDSAAHFRSSQVSHDSGETSSGASTTHLAQRFAAPSTIQHGMPLKELMGSELIVLIGESFASAWSDFDAKRFRTRAARGLDDLEMSQRAQHSACPGGTTAGRLR